MQYLFITISLSTLCVSEICFAQPKPIEVTYSTNSNNEYSFQSKNLNFCDYTVKVEFQNLQNATSSSSLPYIESISSGINTLFTLKPSQTGQNISFQFGYKSQKGRLLSKPPKSFIYLLPFSNQSKHRINDSQNIMEMVSGKKVNNFYGLSFQMKKGDTVFAARRGIVSELKDEYDKYNDGVWFSSQTNFVEVFHQDGTFARYNRLKKGEVLVKEGQNIEVGQALGIVADDAFEGATVAQLMIYYLSKTNAFIDTKHGYDYVKPIFYTKDRPEGKFLEHGESYVSEWAESIVTQEMSKREIKKWKEGRNK